MCSRDGKHIRRGRIFNEGRDERLAKRKQWILFNLIQLIYYGKKGHYKTYPIVFAIHFFLSSNIDTCPVREHKINANVVGFFVSVRSMFDFCNLSQNIYINRKC